MADATDDFNRADGPLGANWETFGDNPPTIVSNQFSSPGFNGARYIGADFGNDHYSEIIANKSTHMAVAVRIQDVDNYYFNFLEGGLFKRVAGNGSFVGNFELFWDEGDTVRLEAIGDQITLYINGISRGTLTDGDLTTGRPGIAGNTITTSWLGGPILAAAGVPRTQVLIAG